MPSFSTMLKNLKNRMSHSGNKSSESPSVSRNDASTSNKENNSPTSKASASSTPIKSKSMKVSKTEQQIDAEIAKFNQLFPTIEVQLAKKIGELETKIALLRKNQNILDPNKAIADLFADYDQLNRLTDPLDAACIKITELSPETEQTHVDVLTQRVEKLNDSINVLLEKVRETRRALIGVDTPECGNIEDEELTPVDPALLRRYNIS